MSTYRIQFLPADLTVEADADQPVETRDGLPGSILALALKNHLEIDHACGGVCACSTCHVIHGGSRPRLVADLVSFEGSDWKMPMGFTLTERGGNCAPGCHVPMSYDRLER